MQSPRPMQNILYHKYLSKRSRSKEIFFSQRLYQYVCLTTSFSFSRRLYQNVCLTTSFSFSQRLSHSVFLTPLPLHIRPHNIVLTTSQFTRNLSVLYKYPKIYQIRLSSDPIISKSFCRLKKSSTLHIYNIFSFTVWSFRTLGPMLHTKVPWT